MKNNQFFRICPVRALNHLDSDQVFSTTTQRLLNKTSAYCLRDMVVATPSKKRTLHYAYHHKQLIKPLAAKLGVSLATVYCAVHEMDETGDPYHHEAKPGCPPSLLPRTKMCIKCSILKGESCTAARAKCVLRIQASAHTISRFLNSIGLHARRPCRKHKLAKLSARVRCVWAESLRNWTDTEWKLVVFTDESKVNLDASDGQQWVCRYDGDSLNPSHVNQKVQGGGISVMVWGCMTSHGFGQLHCIEGTINSMKYMETIKDSFLPSLRDHHLSPSNIILQQDNAGAHRSHMTSKFLTSLVIQTLPWPTNSPDMNIIENVWHILKGRMKNRTPQPATKDQMWQILKEEWAKLGADYCESLYRSCARWVNALWCAREGYTKY